MIRYPGFLAGLLAAGMVFSMGSVDSRAAEREKPYTYQITIYAGNQGKFSDTGEIQVVDAEERLVADAQIEVGSDRSSIRVKGLEAGYRVTFVNAADDGVDLGSNSLYYVKGIRKSGYDNSTVDVIEPVTQDQDYVVAYGIRGDMVSYRIRYEDTSGRTLAPERTFYGNVGDRPVAAYLYLDGYEPQAYNLTKALVKNEAENIFTFVYTRVPAGGGGTTAIVEGTGGTTVVETPAPGAAGAGGAGGAGGGVAGAGGGDGAAADAGAGDAGGAGVNAPDEPVPQDAGPEELIDLDDGEVPLADQIGGIEEGTANMLGAAAVGVTAAAALLALAVILLKRRKKTQVEESEK